MTVRTNEYVAVRQWLAALLRERFPDWPDRKVAECLNVSRDTAWMYRNRAIKCPALEGMPRKP